MEEGGGSGKKVLFCDLQRQTQFSDLNTMSCLLCAYHTHNEETENFALDLQRQNKQLSDLNITISCVLYVYHSHYDDMGEGRESERDRERERVQFLIYIDKIKFSYWI